MYYYKYTSNFEVNRKDSTASNYGELGKITLVTLDFCVYVESSTIFYVKSISSRYCRL